MTCRKDGESLEVGDRVALSRRTLRRCEAVPTPTSLRGHAPRDRHCEAAQRPKQSRRPPGAAAGGGPTRRSRARPFRGRPGLLRRTALRAVLLAMTRVRERPRRVTVPDAAARLRAVLLAMTGASRYCEATPRVIVIARPRSGRSNPAGHRKSLRAPCGHRRGQSARDRRGSERNRPPSGGRVIRSRE